MALLSPSSHKQLLSFSFQIASFGLLAEVRLLRVGAPGRWGLLSLSLSSVKDKDAAQKSTAQ